MVPPSTVSWVLCEHYAANLRLKVSALLQSHHGLLVCTSEPFLSIVLSNHGRVKDTAIVPAVVKIFMAGIPLTPVPRIAGAIFLAATDATPGTNGAVYTLPDDREVFRITNVDLNEGVYALINARAERLIAYVQTAHYRQSSKAHRSYQVLREC